MALSSAHPPTTQRISALTRWGRSALVLAVALACGAVCVLANLLAWRPSARVQLDLSSQGELQLHPASVETLRSFEEPVHITALFSQRPTRRQQVFERLCFGRPERELFARMEAEVRLQAIERVSAWLERMEVAAQGTLKVEWLDREDDFLAYLDAIEKRDLLADGRLRRYLGSVEGLEVGKVQRRRGQSAWLYQGLRELAWRELPEVAPVLDEVEVVDLVIVEQGGRRELLFLEPDLVGIDHSHLWATGTERTPSLVEVRVEGSVLAAAERVLPRGAARVGWIASFGSSAREMPEFLAELERHGAVVRTAPVRLREEGVPSDLDILVGLAPERSMDPAERSALEAFLRRGGALLAVDQARADDRASPWNEALANFGIAFRAGRVSQVRDSSEVGTERVAWLRIEDFAAESEITHAYAKGGWSLALRDAAAIQLGGAREAGAIVYPLLRLPAPGSGALVRSAEEELRTPWLDAAPFDGRVDRSEVSGEFVLAYALELPSGGRLVAVGTLWPFLEAGLRSDARFAAHVMRWLGDRTISASGVAQRLGSQRFEVAGPLGPNFPAAIADWERGQVLAWVLRYALPLLAVALGFVLWWWRRRA